MERKSIRVPGYDCRRGPCPHTPKCNTHDAGIDGGRYYYIVREGDLALVLHVLAADFPYTVPLEVRRDRGTLIGGVSIHAPFPTSREEVLEAAQGKKQAPCDFLDGKPCWNAWNSWTHIENLASVMVRGEYGAAAFTQPEAFWLALEALLTEKAPAILEARADTKWHVCPQCHGDGTVEVVTIWKDAAP